MLGVVDLTHSNTSIHAPSFSFGTSTRGDQVTQITAIPNINNTRNTNNKLNICRGWASSTSPTPTLQSYR